MKKYIKPEMVIFEAKPVEMICLSSGGKQDNVDAEAPFRDFDEEDLDFSDIKLW